MAKDSGSIGEIRKKITKTHELISTSYHESGHTIYALLHMMRVSSVFIFEHKQLKRIHGLTNYHCFKNLDTIYDPVVFNYLLRSEIGLLYAGLTAEKYHYKNISGCDKTPMFIKDCSSADIEAAASAIKKYDLAAPGKKRYVFKQKLIKETLSELQNNWEAVTLVAHALFRHRRLSFEDLREILTKKTHNKQFWKEQFKNISYFYDNHDVLDEKDIRHILSK